MKRTVLRALLGIVTVISITAAPIRLPAGEAAPSSLILLQPAIVNAYGSFACGGACDLTNPSHLLALAEHLTGRTFDELDMRDGNADGVVHLQPGDFAAVDVDGNQLVAGGASPLWVLAFLTNDISPVFSTDAGQFVESGAQVFTCSLDEDCNGNGIPGDGVAVATLVPGTASRQDAPYHIHVEQGLVMVTAYFFVTGPPASVDLSTYPTGETRIATGGDPSGSGFCNVSQFDRAAIRPEYVGLLAQVKDAWGTSLSWPVTWTVTDRAVAQTASDPFPSTPDQTLSVETPSGVVARNLLCGRSKTGTVQVQAQSETSPGVWLSDSISIDVLTGVPPTATPTTIATPTATPTPLPVPLPANLLLRESVVDAMAGAACDAVTRHCDFHNPAHLLAVAEQDTGLSASELDARDGVVDGKAILQPTDFAPVDVDANQLPAGVTNQQLGAAWLLAFRSSDSAIYFDTDAGLFLENNAAHLVCSGDEDCNDDGVRGDGVAVATLSAATAARQEGPYGVHVTQALVTVSTDFVVTGLPASVDLTAYPVGKTQIYDGGAAGGSGLCQVLWFETASGEPQYAGLQARVNDAWGTPLAGWPVNWLVSNRDLAQTATDPYPAGPDSTVTMETPLGIAAPDVLCGRTQAGTVLVTAVVVPSAGLFLNASIGIPVIDPLDPDGDLVYDPADNCPATANPDQADTDGDGYGDACDAHPTTYCAIQRADVNYDGAANLLDLARVAMWFGRPAPPAAMRYDQNADGAINLLDLAKQASVYGQNVSACP